MPELLFKGKEFVYNHHLTVPYRPLIPDPKKSIGRPSTDTNLVIHGDNLHALKALMPTYAGKIDCIFIDPPYNTGNENWSYNDNVNSPLMQEWLNSNPVNKEDMLRHDKWLCMMYPRVKLLYELLSERGSLWMTLDDNEGHRARCLLDEVFGETNFLASVAWEKADSPRMDADYFSTRHDYVIAYAKSLPSVIFHRLDYENGEAPEHYNLEDEEGRKYYLKPLRAMGGQDTKREDRPNLYFPLTAPDGTEVFPKLEDGTDGRWRWSKSKVARERRRIEWRQTPNGWSASYRIYADTATGRPPETIFYNSDVGSSRTALAQIKAIFGGAVEFETPKPLGLLERIIEIATEPDSVILDSFAGSGTTGHAALTANAEDGGKRRFILVEAEDYADSLTAERIRRAISGYSYKGTIREELLRERLTFSSLKHSDKLLQEVQRTENLEGSRFAAIKREIVNGYLVVSGENEAESGVAPLEGTFTYCSLGDALSIDSLLRGDSLPAFSAIGSWLFHTATGQTLRPEDIDESNWYLGETKGLFVWLIYKPDLTFLQSRDAVLTLALAEKLATAKVGRHHLVFAPAKFVSNKQLTELGMDFAQLPFAVYRINRE